MTTAPTRDEPRVHVDGRRRTLTATVHLPLVGADPRGLGPDRRYRPDLLVVTYRLDTSAPHPWGWAALLSGPLLRPSGAVVYRSARSEGWASSAAGGVRPVDGTVATMPHYVARIVRTNRPYFPTPTTE